MLLRRTALPPTLAADGGELRQAAGAAAALIDTPRLNPAVAAGTFGGFALTAPVGDRLADGALSNTRK
jgi:hypothetical protein